MDNNKCSISHRISELVSHFAGGNNSKFAAIIGTSEANIRNYISGTAPKFDVIASIAKSFDLNYDWLLLGNGKMISASKKYPMVSDDFHAGHIVNEATTISFGKSNDAKKGIPLVSTEAIAGFGNMEFAIHDQDIQSFYSVPDFINVNFMIRVKGSSMYPKYNSGDVVACRIIRESQFIQWNKVHVLATKEQGVLIKRLKKGATPECLCAVSDNKDYDPFEIPTNEITGLAIVIGVIRLE